MRLTRPPLCVGRLGDLTVRPGNHELAGTTGVLGERGLLLNPGQGQQCSRCPAAAATLSSPSVRRLDGISGTDSNCGRGNR